MKFELTYYDIAGQHFSHCATGPPPPPSQSLNITQNGKRWLSVTQCESISLHFLKMTTWWGCLSFFSLAEGKFAAPGMNQFHFSYNVLRHSNFKLPSRLGLKNTSTALLQRGRTLPMSVLHMTQKNLMVRFQWCWSFGECRASLHCHWSHVHSGLDWLQLIGPNLWVILELTAYLC